ncbi:MAG: hypothetical protein KIT84_34865 [Labilithrix sp.]|nr:hypothetical protein [Labilithrix sp.]
MLRGALALALVLVASSACKSDRSSKGGASSDASTAGPPPRPPPIAIADLKPIARYDGDFASSFHHGWLARFSSPDVHAVFSRQRTQCTIRPSDPGNPLAAECTSLSQLSLRDDRIETDTPERVTFLDGEVPPLAHWLVVDPSPKYLVTASGDLVAGAVTAAYSWSDGVVSYAKKEHGGLTVLRSDAPKLVATVAHGDTSTEMAAGYAWTRAKEGEQTIVYAQSLARSGPPLGEVTRFGPIPGTPADALRGCGAGDVRWVVVSTAREDAAFSDARAYGIFRVHGGVLSPMLIAEGAGRATNVRCTPSTFELVESTSVGGETAVVVRCTATACSSTPLPRRLISRVGVDLAPMGGRILALWSDRNELSARVDEPDEIVLDSRHAIVLDAKPRVQAVAVRGEEAIVFFSRGVEMYAIAVDGAGRVRPVLRR